MDILERIQEAIKRISSGDAIMRIPADVTDPDVVLSDARDEITLLRAGIAELKEVIEEITTPEEDQPPRL